MSPIVLFFTFSLLLLPRFLLAICNGETSVSCSGSGMCKTDRTPHYCVCFAGYSGLNCATVECAASCSGHGNCLLSSGKSRCACFEGWTGLSCETSNEDALLNYSSPFTQPSSPQHRSTSKKRNAFIVSGVVVVVVAVIVTVIVVVFVLRKSSTGSRRRAALRKENEQYLLE